MSGDFIAVIFATIVFLCIATECWREPRDP